MSIHIRYATAADAEPVADLSRKTFYDTFASQNTEENMRLHMDKYYALETIQAELSDPLNTFILAYSGEQLAGYEKKPGRCEKLFFLNFHISNSPKFFDMKKFLSAALPSMVFALLLIPALSFTALKNSASAQSWDKLGQRKVNFKADRDEISGRWDGVFTAIQIKVNGGSVSMQNMVIHFRNGETREIELRNIFTDGSVSRVIDLPGNRRFIDHVVFWYESTSTSTGGKPIVELWGRH